jgi:hypothetical protein
MALPGKLSMNLILNDKEIIFYLVSLLDYSESFQSVEYNEFNTNEAISWSLDRKKKLHKFRDKIKDRIRAGVELDTNEYLLKIIEIVNHKKQINLKFLKNNLDTVLERLGEEFVIENYRNSSFTGFCKTPGLMINPNSKLIRRKNYSAIREDCLIRNTVGNEKFLTDKIDQSLPFWFIDSGYTNFLEPNKKWHRLVRNHLHYGSSVDVPVNRLGMFKTFPQEWRTDGDKILVIEPGEFAASIFHIDIKTWKYQVEEGLRKYTDKKIVFREKSPKKKRSPLFQHLLDEDYYCVISINSNAATESIWAGIPVITLDKHITNPVSKNKISDINNLYRGPLANWLALLSYSQFTYEELVDGTAFNIVKKYHV